MGRRLPGEIPVNVEGYNRVDAMGG